MNTLLSQGLIPFVMFAYIKLLCLLLTNSGKGNDHCSRDELFSNLDLLPMRCRGSSGKFLSMKAQCSECALGLR